MNNEKIIFFGGSGKPSMKKLHPHLNIGTMVEKVELNSGKEIIRVHKNKNNFATYTTIPKNNFAIDSSIVIRWGNRIPIHLHNCVVYNEAVAVAKASNKKVARQTLLNAKVSIPKFVTPENFKDSDLPVIARPSYHSKCKNMIVLKTKEDFLRHYKEKFPKGWYYSKFIDKEAEYRIHCAHGKVLSISEKPRPKNKTTIGWGYAVVEEEWRVLHWSEYKFAWCVEALKAVKALGLDFGAVDIIVKGKQPYILEVNTAGSLTESEYLRKRYSMYFNWLFSSNKRRDHWKFEEFESGKGLAWKNFQLLENKK